MVYVLIAMKKGIRPTIRILLSLIIWGFIFPAQAALDNKGTEFWLAVPANSDYTTAEIKLFITGDANTTGTVTIPALGFSQGFTVTSGSITTVDLPNSVQIFNSDIVEDKGVHVIADDEVVVYGLNRRQYTTDAFLGLPVDVLGVEYFVLGYKNTRYWMTLPNSNQFAIVATENGTTVTLTMPFTMVGQFTKVPYDITLDRGQTYSLRIADYEDVDFSGTHIKSDYPIAVFGSHECVFIPNLTCCCDYLVEQLPPTKCWGKSFIIMPLATRLSPDTFRFVACRDDTHISINGSPISTLDSGQVYERMITGPAAINSDHPILTAQYSNGTECDGVTSDPFMMLIPPYEQFLSNYTVSTLDAGLTVNYINVVAPDEAVGQILLDGVNIPAGDFTAIGTSGFSGSQVPVSEGSHNLSGPLPFGIFVYGFDEYDSYGYPGGMNLSAVASVANVALSPKKAANLINVQHCIVATLTDSNDAPVSEVRVDFSTSGANAATGFAFTDENGEAQFCYTGSNPGTDAVEASVGDLSDTAIKRWDSENTPTPTPTPSGLIVYPNPFNPEKAVDRALKFKNLPAGVGVQIFTLSGELVRELGEENGMAFWDGRNTHGNMVAVGTYYYVVGVDGRVIKRDRIVLTK